MCLLSAPPTYTLEIGVANSGTIDILGWILLCRGGCLMHCGMVSGILGLYPLSA